LAAVAYAHLAV
jgi:hypothetical protein